MQIDQRDREAMVAYENARPIGLNPVFEERVLAGRHDDDHRVQAFARHRSPDTARIAELEKAILAMKNAQHREEEDYRKAELFALVATTALGGQP